MTLRTRHALSPPSLPTPHHRHIENDEHTTRKSLLPVSVLPRLLLMLMPPPVDQTPPETVNSWRRVLDRTATLAGCDIAGKAGRRGVSVLVVMAICPFGSRCQRLAAVA